MKISVEIDDISLSSKSITIQKLEIGNPKGSILQKAFSSDQIEINTPIRNYFDHHIVIDEVVMHTVYLGLEFDSKKAATGNWSTIMGNMKDSSPAKQEKDPRTVLIKRLILTDIDLDLVYRQEGGKIQKLPRIDHLEFTDVTSEGGIPSDQIAKVILSQTLRSIFEKENLQNMLQNILENPSGGTLEKLIQPFKNLLNFKQPDATKWDRSHG